MTSSQASPSIEQMWMPYADARSGLSFEHPKGWKAERGMSGLLATVVAPERETGFAPNLNVVRRVNDHDYSLDDLARAAVREVRRVLTDVLVIDLDATVVADEPARRLLFSYRQGVYGLTGEQWVWLTPSYSWTVTAGANTEKYDALADVFTRMVRSLKTDPA